MIVIAKPRSSGKTTDALDWLASGSDRYLVVPSLMRREDLIQLVPNYSSRIITWNQFTTNHLDGKNADVFIDDIDLCLGGAQFNAHVSGFTVTSEY